MNIGPQRGILARPQQHLLIATLQFVNPSDATTNQATVEALREILRKELAEDLDEITATTPKETASSETGEVGSQDGWDSGGLTVDVGFSLAGYTAMGYVKPDTPGDLEEVPWGLFGPHAPANPSSGDLVLHIRSNNIMAVEHVLRRVEHSLVGRLTSLWTLSGIQRYAGDPKRLGDKGRALIGFHDGLSNLDPTSDADRELVFVDPTKPPTYPPTPPPTVPIGSNGYGGDPATSTEPNFPADLRQPPSSEPDWTLGGSYMFVRGSLLDVARWDQTPLGTQEAAVGRFKSSGAFRDREDTSANLRQPPLFETDRTSTAVPVTAHARRANPRLAATDPQRRVLRRGYPLIQAGTGGLQRGLTLVTFSRSLSTQIEFILAGWLANADFPFPGAGIDPLLEFETEVLAGGYYFVPALTDDKQPTSWKMPDVTAVPSDTAPPQPVERQAT